MKSPLFILIFLICMPFLVSCQANFAKELPLTKQMEGLQEQAKDFTELKRANKNIVLNEATIITTFQQTLDLYTKLNDKRFSRSEPIPTFDENEFLVVLKPRLKKVKFGDIKVLGISYKDSVLLIHYKEIFSTEYASTKQYNPILILKLSGKIPSGVKLINN